MHSVLRHMLATVRHSIPEQILLLAFNPKRLNISLDEEIINKVVYGRVLDDVNLTSGKDKEIILRQHWAQDIEVDYQHSLLNVGRYGFYLIPPEDREHRAIVRTVRLEYPGYYNNQLNSQYPYNNYHGARLATLSRAVLQSHTQSHHMAVPQVEAKGGGLIQIMPSQMYHMDWILTCMLAYDETFNGLPHGAIKPLCDLVLTAVRSYLYVSLIVPIDQGLIVHGGELGVIRDIVGNWDNEEENYQERLLQFRGGSTLSLKNKSRLLNAML